MPSSNRVSEAMGLALLYLIVVSAVPAMLLFAPILTARILTHPWAEEDTAASTSENTQSGEATTFS